MRVRAPEPSDAGAVLELIAARDIADLGYADYTLEDVKADWARPSPTSRSTPRSRRRGLGRALLLQGLAALRTHGLTTGELFVQTENENATGSTSRSGCAPPRPASAGRRRWASSLARWPAR